MKLPGLTVGVLCATASLGAADVGGESPGVVKDGAWRFTAVTDRLIRVEYDPEEHWVDEPTLAFWARSETPPSGVWIASVSDADRKTFETARVKVSYQPDGPPTAGSVTLTSKDDPKFVYNWGDDPEEGNLRGTARTLDNEAATLDLNCHHKVSPTMENSQMHCAWGLVSKHGWAVVNDTGAPVKHDEQWFAVSKNTVDVSVFLHGRDYTGALKDFFLASGKPAVPPRYALGTMFTRWFNFDSDSTMAMVEDFESRSMPLDAWIFDMNWHQNGVWGSFSWNENDFPNRQALLDWLKGRGLYVGANTHEHDGISTEEVTYDAVCKTLACEFGQNIPFDLYNRSYAYAQEDIAMTNITTLHGKQGIDFSWIDYQQGEEDHFQQTTIPKMNPTILLNHLRSDLQHRHGENVRPMILSRWGGYGNHRYPVGFSGDQHHSWEGLAYLPYFTATAANVAYNYWSHDTVGANDGGSDDFELSVRWVQMTAWSPVLRFHDKGAGTGECARDNHCARVVPWDVPNRFFVAIRQASQQRSELLPYIYSAAVATAETGHALCRPMYYENPADEDLYSLPDQYLFGPDMIVSPITQPSGPDALGFDQALGAIQWHLTAPSTADGWVDRLNGDLANGADVSGIYGIRDVPSLARQGSVIAMRPIQRGESSLSRAMKPLDALEFRIMPAKEFYFGGSRSGSAVVYDDDGLTRDHLDGAMARIVCNYTFDGKTFTFRLSSTGSFNGQQKQISLRLSFPQMPPMQVEEGTSSTGALASSAAYNREILGSSLTFENVALESNPTIKVSLPEAYSKSMANFPGVLGRIRRARYIKDAMDDTNIPYGANRAALTTYVLAATEMKPEFAANLPELWEKACEQVQAILIGNEVLLKDSRRSDFIAKMLANRDDTRVQIMM